MVAVKRQARSGAMGFTLVEMLLSLGIFTVLLAGMIHLFALHTRTYHDQQQLRTLQQNLRFALDTVARDIRMAGYGLCVNRAALSDWLPGWSANPLLTDGTAGHPDTLAIAGALGGPSGSLSVAAPSNSTSIVLGSGEGALFNTTSARLICIGRLELARVLGVMGDTLTISKDPFTTTEGLTYTHAAGSPVERVWAVQYSLQVQTNVFPWQSYLVRQDMSAVVTQSWQRMVAGYIEDFQVVETNYAYRVEIQGRTQAPLRGRRTYAGDRYARLTVSTDVLPRNSPLLRLYPIANP